MSGPFIFGPTGPKNINAPAEGYLFSTADGSINSMGSIAAAATDPALYTPTFTGVGVTTNLNITWARQGKFLILSGYFTTGTVDGSAFSFTLPPSLVADSTVYTSSYAAVGRTWRYATLSAANNQTIIIQAGSNIGYVSFENQNFASSAAATSLYASGEQIYISAQIAIQGWSNVATAQREFFNGYMPSNTPVTANVTKLPFTAIEDSLGAWSGDTYTAVLTADRIVTIFANASSGMTLYVLTSTGKYYILGNNPNGYVAGAQTIPLIAGESLSVYSDTSTTISGGANTAMNNQAQISIKTVN